MLEMKDKLPLDHLPLDQSTGTPGSSVGRVSSIEIRDNIAHKTINHSMLVNFNFNRIRVSAISKYLAKTASKSVHSFGWNFVH